MPDREFFWGVVSAVKPGYYKKLLTDAMEARARADNLANKEQKVIQIKNDVLQKLLDTPSWIGK